MTSVIASLANTIANNNIIASPGGVGPVGDTLLMERRMRSMPEQSPLILTNPSWGSNIVDGNNQSMYRISSGARVFDDFRFPRIKQNEIGVSIKDEDCHTAIENALINGADAKPHTLPDMLLKYTALPLESP